MSAFEKMEKFLSDLQAQKWELTDKKNGLIMRRQARVQELDEALLTGGGADIQAALDAIDGEIAPIDQRIAVIDATLAGRRQSPTLAGLARATITESREGIGQYQAKWDAAAGKLADLDAKRLELVARLGEIAQDAQHFSNRAAQAAERLPSPRPGAPCLATGIIIRHDRRAGCIFPDLQQIEKTFQGA